MKTTCYTRINQASGSTTLPCMIALIDATIEWLANLEQGKLNVVAILI
jgi:hypothetical protein